jgi:pimeloyl-ACP methyl ester carboxylesterase
MKNGKQRLNVNGSYLEYRWIGRPKPGQPTLVFLHEGLGCVDLWKDFPDKLSYATGFSAFVYSRKGYGGSESHEQPRSLDFMHIEGINVLPMVFDIAGIESAILIGHSDGASIAIIHTGYSDDNRIVGLILEAPHLFVEQKTIIGIRHTKKVYEQGNLRERLKRYHGDNVDSAFHGWVEAWLNPEFESWNIEEYVPRISVPIMAVQGCADEYGTNAHIESLKGLLPGTIKIVELPDCGHSPHIDKAQDTLEAMTKFILQIN